MTARQKTPAISFPVVVLCTVLLVAIVATIGVLYHNTPSVSLPQENIIGQPTATTPTSVSFVKTLRTYQQEGYAYMGPYAFQAPVFLQDGSLVVGGYCDIEHNLRKGTFLFGPDGTYRGAANTCLDTSNIRIACPEGGGCQLGRKIADAGNGMFVREAQGEGIVRSPVVYQTSTSGINFISRIFFNTGPITDPSYPGRYDQIYQKPVVVGNTALFVKTDLHAESGNSGIHTTTYHLAAYQLPALTPLWEIPLPGSNVREEYQHGAAGQYHIMAISEPLSSPGMVKVTLIASTIGSNGLIEKNRIPLGEGRINIGPNMPNDPLDPAIFAITKSTDSAGLWVIRFRATDAGIVKIDERYFPRNRPLPSWVDYIVPSSSSPFSIGYSFGIAGDYLVTGSSLFSPPRAFKGTQEILVSHPDDMFSEKRTWLGRPVGGTAIDKEGNVVITTGERVLLYKINGFSPQTTPPTTVPPSTTPPPSTPDNTACQNDNDCNLGWCNDGTCETECETDDHCADDEFCTAGLCEILDDQQTTATFTASTATCTIGTLKLYCNTPITWTSTGTDKIQLWRAGTAQLACANAGDDITKNIRATNTARTYQLYPATTCNRQDADKNNPLDTIIVQAS